MCIVCVCVCVMFMWCERACVFTNELARARVFLRVCVRFVFSFTRFPSIANCWCCCCCCCCWWWICNVRSALLMCDCVWLWLLAVGCFKLICRLIFESQRRNASHFVHQFCKVDRLSRSELTWLNGTFLVSFSSAQFKTIRN